MGGFELDNGRRERCAREVRPSNLNHTGGILGRCEYELSKITIFGQEQSGITACPVDDYRIVGTHSRFGCRRNVVVSQARRPNDGEIATLVRQKTHRAASQGGPAISMIVS